MLTDLLDYELPQELIAVRPPQERDGGRMCIVEEDGVRHGQVRLFPDEIRENDLIVINRTKVRKARLFCQRPKVGSMGGARVELLFLHPLTDGRWVVLGKANRPLRPGDELEAPGARFFIEERGEDGTLHVRCEGDVEGLLDRQGSMPIPPYMQREGDQADESRYQTVFSEQLGSAAAPTAGLHITDEMMERFVQRGASVARVTLHVGIGTFRPVMADDLNDHPMHSEEIEVNDEAVGAIERAKARGGRVIAIGTTAVRALESSADQEQPGRVLATKRATDLLIQPGYRFNVVDALWTNFHQPRSTLLALVSAFTGLERMKNAYEEALRERYRFLSYGDAMWIPRAWGAPK